MVKPLLMCNQALEHCGTFGGGAITALKVVTDGDLELGCSGVADGQPFGFQNPALDLPVVSGVA